LVVEFDLVVEGAEDMGYSSLFSQWWNYQLDLTKLSLSYADYRRSCGSCSESMLDKTRLHQKLQEAIVQKAGFASKCYQSLSKRNLMLAKLGNLAKWGLGGHYDITWFRNAPPHPSVIVIKSDIFTRLIQDSPTLHDLCCDKRNSGSVPGQLR